mgnify:CR=1 FL=1
METSYISRREQAQLTKKKIFDTTMFLIKKKGYSKITIREICQNAQISIGTFYLYFSSKDEILLEIYNKIDQKISFPRPDDPKEAPSFIIQDFSIYLECMIQSFDKELLREIYRNSLISGENHFLSPKRPLFEAVLELVSSIHTYAGFKKEVPPDELCRRLHIFVQSYIFQWLVSDELSPGYLAGFCLPELKNYLSLYIDFQ